MLIYVVQVHIRQKLTITIKSQAVSSTEYFTENWEEKYTASHFLDGFLL